jgi:hypothetical protein
MIKVQVHAFIMGFIPIGQRVWVRVERFNTYLPIG